MLAAQTHQNRLARFSWWQDLDLAALFGLHHAARILPDDGQWHGWPRRDRLGGRRDPIG